MPDTIPSARILLLDDHALFRESLARFLNDEPGFQMAGCCGTIDEARKILQEKAVDLVLLDFDLGRQNGLDFMRVAESIGFQGKVLLVTAGLDDVYASILIRLGVVGIFLKHNPYELLSEAIRKVLSGKVWFEQGQLQKIVAGPFLENEEVSSTKLTTREREVLSFVFQGVANREIVNRLQLPENSVKATVQQLFQKTGARSRSQLVRIVLERYTDQL
jgi:two-component system, NarL family, nitrate/nitrite response regulator NarL